MYIASLTVPDDVLSEARLDYHGADAYLRKVIVDAFYKDKNVDLNQCEEISLFCHQKKDTLEEAELSYIISETKASMEIEGMKLKENEVEDIYNVISGKESGEAVRQRIIAELKK
ncbi:MAG: hypothetical protein IJ153_03810 [Clostridia bacterium]|nr:hypothetical protein [Clostridia bacterium]